MPECVDKQSAKTIKKIKICVSLVDAKLEITKNKNKN